MTKVVFLLTVFSWPSLLLAESSSRLIDFEAEEVLLPPASVQSFNGRDEQVLVIDTEESREKSSAESAKVLQLSKLAENDEIPRATSLLPPGISGELSFKMVLASEDYQNPLLNLFIFSEDLTKIGPSVFFTPGRMTVVSAGESQRFPVNLPENEMHWVQVLLFDDHTYAVKINGRAIPNETTRFHYQHSGVGLLTHLQFAIGEKKRADSRVYVDDIRIPME